MTEPQPNGGFEWTQEPWGLALRCAPLLPVADHLFTTANLRLVDDVREWNAVAERTGVSREDLRLIHQVHGTDVSVVRAGAGAPPGRPQADIIISDDPHAAIAVRVADCAAILMADRRLGVVGAAHAGWRGAVKRAAVRAIEAMTGTFRSDPADVVAAVGPCLGPCCGEVGPEILEEFRAAGHSEGDLERWFAIRASGRPYLNLWDVTRHQLEHAGVPAAQIHVAEICTKTHPTLFHSYRAHGRHAGRMAGLIRARQV